MQGKVGNCWKNMEALNSFAWEPRRDPPRPTQEVLATRAPGSRTSKKNLARSVPCGGNCLQVAAPSLLVTNTLACGRQSEAPLKMSVPKSACFFSRTRVSPPESQCFASRDLSSFFNHFPFLKFYAAELFSKSMEPSPVSVFELERRVTRPARVGSCCRASETDVSRSVG